MLPVGIISVWSGSIATIPGGWHLCDGTVGTPDLRDKFILGAGTSFNPDDTGGSLNHDHTFTGDGHTHTLVAGDPIQTGTGRSQTTTVIPAAGTTGPAALRPPFFALAYIMRI